MTIKNNTGNGALRGTNAMPQKGRTSDGQASFNMMRRIYQETAVANPDVNVNLQKKWFGNRDASQVVANRRNTQGGKGSMNKSNDLISFTDYRVINTVNSALGRVRSSGAVPSPKINAKRNNGLTLTYSPIENKQLYGLKSPYLHH